VGRIAGEETQHKVTLTKGFFLGKYEVTQEEYQKVMGKNPSRSKGNRLPIDDLSWLAAKEFCEKLNSMKGLST
jgi:formylglycine-generating enzyme required for sulfatase activity